MYIKKIEIAGFKGFGEKTSIFFSIPDGKTGSGINVFVGPNNSGKSTIVECIQIMTRNIKRISFDKEERNPRYGNKIEISLYSINNQDEIIRSISTVEQGGSETIVDNKAHPICFPIMSRRFFSAYFGAGDSNTKNYAITKPYDQDRNRVKNEFLNLLSNIYRDNDKYIEFNKLLSYFMGRELTWRIERNRGQNYIEIEKKDNIFHTTLGLGDGIISLLFITASLFNIDDLDVILIDEPELSLHPEIQKRVMKKILEISQNKQIIIATHSPYFIDFDILINGGKIYRCINTGNVNIRSVSEDTIDFIKSCKKNIFNPHILGLDAKEIFFLDDNVILVEGQEDVILFNNYILPSYPDISINVTFFGWGTGGNHNSPKIAKLLYELGYEKVAIVLDECHDYEEIKREISEFASEYYTDKIPAMDIRKSKTIGDTEYLGLLDEDDEYNIRDEYKSDTHKLLTGLSTYFE